MRDRLIQLSGCLLLLCWTAAGTFDDATWLDLPVRTQWGENYGYCGETSMIAAGLYYGQYLSQYEARRLASDGVDQSRVDSQLLLGVNDLHAADQMRLRAEAWTPAAGQGAREFLAWVKRQVAAHHPVVIGIYMNAARFHRGTAGDSEYDHIVPVLGFITRHRDLDYHDDDLLVFSDNGTYRDGGRPYVFQIRFQDLLADRGAANLPAAPVYSVPAAVPNYGIAVLGVQGGDALPVTVRTRDTFEAPEIRDGSGERPADMPQMLTVEADLDPGVGHVLYRYSDVAAVPTGTFNALAWQAAEQWWFPPGTRRLEVHRTQRSSEVAVFRLVEVTAP